MALTTEQLLLINNLMYLSPSGGFPASKMENYQGNTIGEWINAIDVNAIEAGKDYGNFTTGEEWKCIIEAVRNDDALMNMTIETIHVDQAEGGGRGRSAVFTSPDTGDAVVAFKGTQGAEEWADNFTGGNVVETPQQQNALQWYKQAYETYGLDNYEVTVTGHSKGGNKAKYIAVMDDTVDHCVSVDGQGFSDSFMETYADRIAQRQGIIENHNIDYDFVNPLLNDIGTSTFYTGHNYGNGGFLENHCPNTFFQFHEDGTFSLTVNPDGQPEEMQALDQFLNNILRSMPEEDRQQMLELVNIIVTNAFSFGDHTMQENIEFFLELAADPQYSDDFAYFIAYLVEYQQENPELAEHINSVLEKFGMGDATEIVDIVTNILNFEMDTPFGTLTFDGIWDFVDSLSGSIPNWILDALIDYLRDEFGITMTREQMRELLGIIGQVNENMDTITIEDNGQDIRIDGSASAGPDCAFAVQPRQLQQVVPQLINCANKLNQVASAVGEQAGRIDHVFSGVTALKVAAAAVKEQTNTLGRDVGRLADALQEIAQLYQKTEQNVTSKANQK